MNDNEPKGTALITGASFGIGAVYADRLARRGNDLIIVARNKNRLAALARRLEIKTGRSVETTAADLNDKADLAGVEKLLRTNASITLLVNNAGVGAAAQLVDSDVDKMDEMIRLNIGALTRLTYAPVPSVVARGGGTKAFVLAFSQSLNHELAGKGVRVQAVLFGATATEFWDTAGLPVHNLPAQIVMSAEDMVDAALAGFDQGEIITIPSLPDKAEWDRFDTSRRAMFVRLSSAIPAPRYNITNSQSARA
jgi:short-subunit dehydrogenase